MRRGRHSLRRVPPHLLTGDNGLCHDRNSLYLSTGTQSAAGDCAALVLPQPLPRVAGTASVPGMHQFVNRAKWDRDALECASEPAGRSAADLGVSCPGRSAALLQRCIRRAGTNEDDDAVDPGSAAHHAATVARCAASGERFTNEGFSSLRAKAPCRARVSDRLRAADTCGVRARRDRATHRASRASSGIP
jgi:hypothetical protein